MCFFFKYIKTFIFFLVCSLHLNTFCQCVAAGTNVATSSVNNTGVGSIGWSNMTGIYAADNIYTSAGALLGCWALRRQNASGLLIGSSIKDNPVYIVKGGTITGANHASAAASGSNSTMTYGNNADLWGTTFTPAQINAANFGVAMSANIDEVTINVYITMERSPSRWYRSAPMPKTGISASTGQLPARLTPVIFRWKNGPEGTWSGIATAKAAGNSTTLKQYTADDQEPGEINYYRVKQVDLDHQESASKIIAISYSKARETAIYVYPVAGKQRSAYRDEEQY